MSFTTYIFHYNMNFGRKDDISYQSKNNGKCNQVSHERSDSLKFASKVRFLLTFPSFSQKQITHTFRAEAQIMHSLNHAFSLSESAQKCLFAYFYTCHTLTVLQLILTSTYRKTVTARSVSEDIMRN